MTTSAIPLPSRRARKALALTAISASFLGSAVYWLATAGDGALAIAPAPGLSATGEIADVTTILSAITQSTGNAQLQAGKAIAKADVAKDFAHRMKVSIAWTNPKRSSGVLNQNGQISFGVYYPVSTTASGCTGTVNGQAKSAVTDGATTFCGALDSAAKGSPTVSTGKLLLSNASVAGWIGSTVDATASPAACAADSGLATTWCQPAGLDANKRRIYIVAAIQNPASKVPPGQQQNVDDLAFFVKIRRNSSDAT